MESHTQMGIRTKGRRSVRHTKTGCRSCKIRRIKCDEGRPVCARCLDFGVECDGYAPVVPAPRLFSSTRPLLPRPPIGQLLQSSLCLTPFQSDLEARYFDSFCKSIVHEVLPYCQCTIHSPMIWGASGHPSIRYAFVAIAALYEASVASTHVSELSSDTSKKHYRMAMEHYTKSIKLMNHAVVNGEQNLQTTLITCFVIFGFEAFVGDIDQAMIQLQTGMALIEDWQGNNNNSKSPDRTLNEVIACFLTLEVQLPANRDSRPIKRHKKLIEESASVIRNMPRVFTTPTEAEGYLQIVQKRIRHYLQISNFTASPICNDNNEQGREIKTYQECHEAELNQWNAAFQPLLLTMDVELDINKLLNSSFMQLRHITSYVVLKTDRTSDEMIYDRYAPEFAQMVSLALNILRVMAGQGKAARFSFDLIVIPSMYLVGMKCRIRSTRRQAIELLLSRPRREGIWDGILYGKIAEWVRKVEDDLAADYGIIPAWARVIDVQSSFNLRKRYARLSCQQRVGDGLYLKEKKIRLTW